MGGPTDEPRGVECGAAAAPPASSPAPLPSPSPPQWGPPPALAGGVGWQYGAVGDFDDVPIPMAKVRVGNIVTATATYDGATLARGAYRALVSRTDAVHTILSAPGYLTLVDQEWIPDADEVHRYPMKLVDDARADRYAARVPDADPRKGTVAVKVFADPRCFSGESVKLSIVPAGAAKVVYFDDQNMPDRTRSAARADEMGRAAITAAFYDIEPNVRFRVAATSPSCRQRAYPIWHDGVQLTGEQYTEGGRSVSFYRVFLD
jgi:hypothetical protein